MKVSRTIVTCAARIVSLILLLLAIGVLDTLATSRVQRRFDGSNGLSVPTVFSLAQDTEGFIWIGTVGSLASLIGRGNRPPDRLEALPCFRMAEQVFP